MVAAQAIDERNDLRVMGPLCSPGCQQCGQAAVRLLGLETAIQHAPKTGPRPVRQQICGLWPQKPEVVCPAGLVDEDARYLMPFLVQDERFAHVVPRHTGVPAAIRALIQQVHVELHSGSAGARLCARALLKVILALLVKHYAPYEAVAHTYGQRRRDLVRLQPVFDWIGKHYPEPVRLEEAAAIINMSRTHFTRLFRRVTGQSFVSYLLGYRVAKARALLSSTNKSIAEVSQEVGFGNQSHFGAVFRRLVGVSAREYRSEASR
jgi:AraC-like DNA-binding protein